MTCKNPTQGPGQRRSPKTGSATAALWTTDVALTNLNKFRGGPVDRSNLVSLAKKIKEVRAARSLVFAPELFGEPAWDLLLALYIAEGDQFRLKVTAASNISNVPETTALRWLSSLHELGLLEYKLNPTDARSRYVALSDAGVAMMDQMLTIASSNLNSI